MLNAVKSIVVLDDAIHSNILANKQDINILLFKFVIDNTKSVSINTKFTLKALI